MQSTSNRDLVVGLFVLAGLLALFYLSFQVGGLSLVRGGGMKLFATFDDVGGLTPRGVLPRRRALGRPPRSSAASPSRSRAERSAPRRAKGGAASGCPRPCGGLLASPGR